MAHADFRLAILEPAEYPGRTGPTDKEVPQLLPRGDERVKKEEVEPVEGPVPQSRA
jgi:hypothetical protein